MALWRRYYAATDAHDARVFTFRAADGTPVPRNDDERLRGLRFAKDRMAEVELERAQDCISDADWFAAAEYVKRVDP